MANVGTSNANVDLVGTIASQPCRDTDPASKQLSRKSETISDLESRYVKLLESKIAQLESQLGNSKLESGPRDKVCLTF